MVGDYYCIGVTIGGLGAGYHAAVVLEHAHGNEVAADGDVIAAGVALSQKLDARVFPHAFGLAADNLQ